MSAWPAPRAWPAAAVAAALASPLAAGVAGAQLGDPRGPGESVAQPQPMCSQTISCSYDERNALGPAGGYRFQALNVCGANCTTQYWVSDMATGRLLLSIPPIRGGGLIASGAQPNPQATHPPVRVLVPDYGPTDPACCPSGHQETTYTWDPTTNSLVTVSQTVIPAAQFPGWAQLRQQWQNEHFFPVFPGS